MNLEKKNHLIQFNLLSQNWKEGKLKTVKKIKKKIRKFYKFLGKLKFLTLKKFSTAIIILLPV